MLKPRRPRADSLYARLKTKGRRETVFRWLYEEGISYREATELILQRFGVETKQTVVRRMAKEHAYAWRFGKARERVAMELAQMPDDLDDTRRKALAQREFTAVADGLSFREVMWAKKQDTDRDRLKMQLDFESQKIALARRKVDLLEEKIAPGKEEGAPGLSAEEKQRRIRQIFGLQ
jgi:hypothetical protein